MSAEAYRPPIWCDEEGASAVEFAIVGPILIVAMIGIFAVGWSIYSIATVRLAVEQAGRILSLNPTMTETQVGALVRERAGDQSVKVTLSIDPQVGDQRLAHVTADYTVTIAVPLLPSYSFNYDTSITVPLAPL